MSNHEQPSEPDPNQPDPTYEQLGPSTQVFAEYIATGRLDPSTLGPDTAEDLREIDSLYVEMFTKIKSLVYECLSNHGTLPPLTGLPPELQLMVRVFTEQYYNDTSPPPPDTPPLPDIPQ